LARPERYFGKVEETGILLKIEDIYEQKKDRHLNTYTKEFNAINQSFSHQRVMVSCRFTGFWICQSIEENP
jgi:hypothetical protein